MGCRGNSARAAVEVNPAGHHRQPEFVHDAGLAIAGEGSRRLHERAPSLSELHLLEGRYHEPFNDLGSDEVFQLIADWVRRS